MLLPTLLLNTHKLFPTAIVITLESERGQYTSHFLQPKLLLKLDKYVKVYILKVLLSITNFKKHLKGKEHSYFIIYIPAII